MTDDPPPFTHMDRAYLIPAGSTLPYRVGPINVVVRVGDAILCHEADQGMRQRLGIVKEIDENGLALVELQ